MVETDEIIVATLIHISHPLPKTKNSIELAAGPPGKGGEKKKLVFITSSLTGLASRKKIRKRKQKETTSSSSVVGSAADGWGEIILSIVPE